MFCHYYGRVGSAVVVRELRKSYGSLEALAGVDLDIEPGEVFALLGPNGAGKTTLIEILEGYRTRTAGDVRVLGVDPSHPTQEWRSRIGIVLQSPGLFEELKVEELIAHFAGFYAAPMSVDHVIEMVGLQGKRTSRCSALSGGQKRRVDLALGIIGDPDLIFLDEPTTHLDMASVEALVQALKDYEGTLCFISHDLYFVNSLADHILHVEGGKVTLYPGNYEYFQRRLAQKAEEDASADDRPAAAAPRPTPSPSFSSPGRSAAEDRDKLKENQKSRDKKRRQLNASIRELEDELLKLTTKQASIFVQSDYQKLMELDESIKRAEKELAEAKEELAKLTAA